jgi:hypothetical protein
MCPFARIEARTASIRFDIENMAIPMESCAIANAHEKSLSIHTRINQSSKDLIQQIHT